MGVSVSLKEKEKETRRKMVIMTVKRATRMREGAKRRRRGMMTMVKKLVWKTTMEAEAD
jgi:hypothetical protein